MVRSPRSTMVPRRSTLALSVGALALAAGISPVTGFISPMPGMVGRCAPVAMRQRPVSGQMSLRMQRSGNDNDLQRTVELRIQKAAHEHAAAPPPEMDGHLDSCDKEGLYSNDIQLSAEAADQAAVPSPGGDGKLWTRILVLVIAMLYGANAAPHVCGTRDEPPAESSLRPSPPHLLSQRRRQIVLSSGSCVSSCFLCGTHWSGPTPHCMEGGIGNIANFRPP